MDPYAGTGGTTGTLDAPAEYWGEPDATGQAGAPTGEPEAPSESGWATGWEWTLGQWAKSDMSASVDAALEKANKPAQQISDAAQRWLGYAGDPEKIAKLVQNVTIIAVVLGVVYVIAQVAPIFRSMRQ